MDYGSIIRAKNGRFKTDISKGKPHGQDPTLGSVFGEPLAGSQVRDDVSLWLAHVVATEDLNDECAKKSEPAGAS